MPECSRRHKCFAERVFPGGVVSNENENGSNGNYPAISSASMLRLHVYSILTWRPLLVLLCLNASSASEYGCLPVLLRYTSCPSRTEGND